MLTRNDATVENALELIEIARPLRLKHIGFKDVGADSALLRRLAVAIREAGASPWMEIVATTRESELRGVELGRDLGVDMLMGGVHVEEALKLLGGSATRYLPFAGAPSGHPTRLGGSAAGSRGAMPKLRETRLRGRRHSCLSRDRGRAARPRRRLPARISQFRHGRGRGKHQFRGASRRRSRRRSGRLHHRRRGDRGLLRARRRTVVGAARGGARRLRRGGVSEAAR